MTLILISHTETNTFLRRILLQKLSEGAGVGQTGWT